MAMRCSWRDCGKQLGVKNRTGRCVSHPLAHYSEPDEPQPPDSADSLAVLDWLAGVLVKRLWQADQEDEVSPHRLDFLRRGIIATLRARDDLSPSDESTSVLAEIEAALRRALGE